MDTIDRGCCGLDVHKDIVVACLRRPGSDGGGPSMTDGYAGKDGKRPHERPIFDRARAAADQKPQPEKRHRSRSVDRIAGGGPR